MLRAPMLRDCHEGRRGRFVVAMLLLGGIARRHLEYNLARSSRQQRYQP